MNVVKRRTTVTQKLYVKICKVLFLVHAKLDSLVMASIAQVCQMSSFKSF